MEAKKTYRSKTLKLSQTILSDIKRKSYLPGSFLPAQDELAERYDVCRDTVRKAVDILAEEGHLLKDSARGVRIPYMPMGGSKVEDKKVAEWTSSQEVHAVSAQKYNIAAIWAAIPDGHQIDICTGIESYARGLSLQEACDESTRMYAGSEMPNQNGKLNIQLFFQPQGHEEAIRVLQQIQDNSIDGVIVYPYPHEGYIKALRDLTEKHFPVVCLDRQVADIPLMCSVEVYNLSGVYQETCHLIEKYHRPVYMLTDEGEHSATKDRYKGYCQAMCDAGYESLIESHTFRMHMTETDMEYWGPEKRWLPGFIAAEKMLREVKSPISVVCVYDYAARGLYEAAAKRNLVIGKDVVVTGFDDLPMAKLLNPPLTTVRQPRRRLGYEAAKLVHRLILGECKPPIHIHLPVELILRQSS